MRRQIIQVRIQLGNHNENKSGVTAFRIYADMLIGEFFQTLHEKYINQFNIFTPYCYTYLSSKGVEHRFTKQNLDKPFISIVPLAMPQNLYYPLSQAEGFCDIKPVFDLIESEEYDLYGRGEAVLESQNNVDASFEVSLENILIYLKNNFSQILPTSLIDIIITYFVSTELLLKDLLGTLINRENNLISLIYGFLGASGPLKPSKKEIDYLGTKDKPSRTHFILSYVKDLKEIKDRIYINFESLPPEYLEISGNDFSYSTISYLNSAILTNCFFKHTHFAPAEASDLKEEIKKPGILKTQFVNTDFSNAHITMPFQDCKFTHVIFRSAIFDTKSDVFLNCKFDGVDFDSVNLLPLIKVFLITPKLSNNPIHHAALIIICKYLLTSEPEDLQPVMSLFNILLRGSTKKNLHKIPADTVLKEFIRSKKIKIDDCQFNTYYLFNDSKLRCPLRRVINKVTHKQRESYCQLNY